MNPILPLEYHVPDVEAKVFKDGKIYLYGSYDIAGNARYCSEDYYVFSSEDFKSFTTHKNVLTSRNNAIGWADGRLYAPDCIERDGKYYLFFCLNDGSEGVAVSGSPTGPFKNPVPVIGADKTGIDPTVLADDDGQVYYYWGQGMLHAAQMNADLRSLDMDTYTKCLISQDEHGFHEGASICKYNGKYYLLYTDISRGRATCLSYAVSDRPLGPYVKGGVVIDNTGCDPKSWNNHGSLCEIDNQWYVFYHRSTNNSFYSRRVCVEPVYFEADGSIKEVEMTTSGQSRKIGCREVIEASRSSRLGGSVYIKPYYESGRYSEKLTDITNMSWAEYKYLDFNGERSFKTEIGEFAGEGVIELHTDFPDGECIGSVKISHDTQKNGAAFSAVKAIYGRKALYLVFKGSDASRLEIKRFWFEE